MQDMMFQTVRGYIDPTTTTVLVTSIAGVVISCGVMVSLFWKKIKMFFLKNKMKRLERKLSKQADQAGGAGQGRGE